MQPLCRQNGFTVVELVIVIVLLGILSAVAISASVSPDAFGPRLASQFFSQQFDRAQVLARQRQDATIAILFTPTADGWDANTEIDGAVYRSETLEDARVTGELSVGGGSQTTMSSLRVTLDGLGGVASAVLNSGSVDPSTGLQLHLTGSRTVLLCIYPNGYVTEATCA